MADDDSAEAIRRRMSELRRELSCDVQQVGEEVGRTARVMTDWTFYVRRFPWAVAALALAGGYLLVPRKKQIIQPDPATIAEMIKKKEIRVETKTKQDSTDRPGMIKGLVIMAITAGAKMGANYIGESMRQAAFHKMNESSAPPPIQQPQTTRSSEGHARQPH